MMDIGYIVTHKDLKTYKGIEMEIVTIKITTNECECSFDGKLKWFPEDDLEFVRDSKDGFR